MTTRGRRECCPFTVGSEVRSIQYSAEVYWCWNNHYLHMRRSLLLIQKRSRFRRLSPLAVPIRETFEEGEE